jgi:cytochrome P450/nitrite reductase/ring-hydroxylating ferredoxin subunit
MNRIQIATLAELAHEQVTGAEVAGVDLVAVACGDDVAVFEGRCPHQGTLLAEGYVEDGRLVCRGHGWQFSCPGGVRIDDDQVCLHRFAASLEDGQVMVDPAEVAAWAEKRESNKAEADDRQFLSPEQLPGPPGLPVIGNLHQLKVDKIHLIYEEWYRQYGDLYQIRLGRQRAVVCADGDMVREMLQGRPHNFSRLNDITKSIEEMGIQGLFSAEGEQWRRHRQLAKHAFDMRHLRDFFPTMKKVTRRLQRRWQQAAAQRTLLDVQKELMRYTVDITTNLAFGYDMNTLEEEGDVIQQHLERVFPMLAYRVFMPVRHWNYVKLPADRALDNSLAELRVSVDHFIDNARQELDETPALRERPQNLLQALLAAQEKGDVEISDLEIFGNVMTFLIAGEDTTANSMAWMMYFMTRHTDVQRKMQAEADAVLGDELTVTDYATMSKLDYIEAVAHETMRLKPVASFLGLQALKDVTVKRLQIPQGTPVFLLLRPKGLEEQEFKDGTAFKPERWLNYSRHENPHHRTSFMPFGGGPRLCPGRSLALLEIKMAVSMICHNFEVVASEPERDTEERFVFTTMPDQLMLTLRPQHRQVQELHQPAAELE